ncbi:microtubule-associated protein 9 [Pelobates fuscus]|uniref:microtubule-associated protein 9 n=1 Tax=Pelobates fuscus TaxID=191477 RepID=UPI002FE4A600
MDSEEEDFSTTLAYTKSPKTAKRTSFQDELKRALNARVSRQQAIEETANSDYSDEFDSDDSLNESSDDKKTFQSTAKKTLRRFPISDDESDDFPKKVSFLKNKNDINMQDGPSAKTTDNNENSQLKFPHKKSKELRILDDNENKPTPKPREIRSKSPSSSPGVSASLSEERVKPTPTKRNFLKKGSHIDKDSGETEETHSSPKHASLSAPSSLTRLHDKNSASEILSFTERHSSQGHRISNQPSMDSSINSKFQTRSLSFGENSLTLSKELPDFKDLEIKDKEPFGVSESQGNGKKSPSVLEMMLKTVYEKTKHSENDDHPLQEMGDNSSFDQQTVLHGKHSKEDNSELDQSDASRTLPSEHSSKRASKHHARWSAKSRYLGTLTLLDKAIKDNSCDVEPADVLRATVYQNWLEKKKVFIQELHKIKKTEEEEKKKKSSKDKSFKNQEATAAFHSWKLEKQKEIKQMLMKQREEEEKKMNEVQETLRKKEEAQKTFEIWKENKKEYLKEKMLKEKQLEMEKKRKEQESIKEKQNDNKSAVKSWKEKKEHVLKQKKREKMTEKMKLEKLKAEKEEQEKRAMEIYEEWLEKKERRERIEQKQKKLQILLNDDPPPPWSPPGKIIPTGK